MLNLSSDTAAACLAMPILTGLPDSMMCISNTQSETVLARSTTILSQQGTQSGDALLQSASHTTDAYIAMPM